MAKTVRLGALAAVGGTTLMAVGLLVLIQVVIEAHPAETTYPGQKRQDSLYDDLGRSDLYDQPWRGR
jgi:hypothetical protein